MSEDGGESRFGGLRDELDEDEDEEETGSSSGSQDDSDTPAQPDDTSTDDSTQQDEDSSAPVEADASEDIDLTEPAFPYRNEMHCALYVKPDIWDEYERTVRFEIERTLHQHGVSDPTGRELGTAAIETVLNHPEEVAEYVLEHRGLSIDLTDE